MIRFVPTFCLLTVGVLASQAEDPKYAPNTSWGKPQPKDIPVAKAVPVEPQADETSPDKKQPTKNAIPAPNPKLATETPGSRGQKRTTSAPKATLVTDTTVVPTTQQTGTNPPESNTARTVQLSDQQKRELDEMARKSQQSKEQKAEEQDMLRRNSDTWRHVSPTITERRSSTKR